MKNILATLLLVGCAALAGAMSMDSKDPMEQEMIRKASEMYKSGGDEGPDPAMELEHYSRSLQLDDAQRAKVLAILEEKRRFYRESSRVRRRFQQETAALHQRILKLNEDFHKELKSFDGKHAKALARIREALSEEQKTRFDAMESERARLEEEFRRMRVEQQKRGQDSKTRSEKR